jgi:hypothetical protein
MTDTDPTPLTERDQIPSETDIGEPEDTIAGPQGGDAPYPDEDPDADEEADGDTS